MNQELFLVEHLAELRKRIIISLVSLVICSAGAFPFASYVLKIFKLPASGLIDRLVFFSPQEGFLVYMHIVFLLGLIISMPVIAYQVWEFILPALQKRQKKYAGIFVVFCSLSFIIGCVFAYSFLLPPALKFLLGFASESLEPVISAGQYISFVIGIMVGCGLVFQMPVLSLILTKLGIINARALRKKYKYAIVFIFIVAAIVTPTPDAFNMALLATPMLMLFEISIWISFFVGRKQVAL